MAKPLIANYIEHTDASTKIMVVQIGKDNINIKQEIFDKIFSSIKAYKYETGGIVGVNQNREIIAFQFDETYNSNPYEYHPNADFLSEIINEKWAAEDIEFVGFVHSHLNNCEISKQDIEYAKEILGVNQSMNDILIGVVDLSKYNNVIEYYLVSQKGVKKIKLMTIN